jgi:hypothetical protein
LPLNPRDLPNSLLDTSLGAKTYRGEVITGQRMKQLAQIDPPAAAQATEFRGRPTRGDYCSGTVGWMSSDLEGVVTNSFLSGDDYSGSHVGYPGWPFPGPNYGDQPGNPSYWLGYNMPRWFGACSGIFPTGSTDADCDDWIVFVQPDPEYQFLQMADQGPGGYQGGNYNLEHQGSLENEIDQWLLPIGFRPEPGDRIYMTGRWIVDCGHSAGGTDWHGELHPIESYVSSHVERADPARRPGAIGGIQTIAKVVVTGTWPAYPDLNFGESESNSPLRLQVWPPARPSADAVLRFEKTAPPQGNFGLNIWDRPLPATNTNHIEIVVTPSSLETGFPRTHDYNQVYDPPDGVRLGRRMAAIYYLWWEKGPPVSPRPPPD